MTDLDDRLALAEKLGAAVMTVPVTELRRLRAIEDAARNLMEYQNPCDDTAWTVTCHTCRDASPDSPEDWCATCALVHALEAGRG